jgi:hypothetical protein
VVSTAVGLSLFGSSIVIRALVSEVPHTPIGDGNLIEVVEQDVLGFEISVPQTVKVAGFDGVENIAECGKYLLR